MLRGNQFAELNRHFTEIQAAYKSGLITDEDLLADFRVFYATDPALESKYELWVRQMPNSYVAHLARGIYYKKVGQERRGGNFISDTAQAQIEGMERALALASEDLRASLSLDEKPLLSYLHLIQVRMFQGRSEENRSLLNSANKIDPRNFIVRQAYMYGLQTRWGGSVEEMRQYLNECRSAQLSASQLQTLEGLVEEDDGWSKQHQDGDWQGAVKSYLKAAELKPEGSCEPCGPVGKAADALFDAGKYQDAIPLYSKVLGNAPNSIPTLDHRGFSELQVGDPTSAITDLTRAADLGDPYAMDTLGKMYLVGTSVPADRDTAIRWLKRAAALGYQPSRDILPMALNPAMKPLPNPDGPRL